VKALAVAALADIVQGRLNEPAGELGEQPLVQGFNVDSRSIEPGQVFVATRGERVDGHDFAAAALERGAVAVLSERDLAPLPCIVVEDCVAALGQVAAWYRREVLTATVIALTGSSGKTTTKDLIAGVLDGDVVAARGSFNTEIGVPLTILAAEPIPTSSCSRWVCAALGTFAI